MTNKKANDLLAKVTTVDGSKKGLIFFTDFHGHLFEEFSEHTGDQFINSRFKAQVETLDAILHTASETGQVVVCGGDLFHKRGAVNTVVFNRIYQVFQSYSNVPVLIVRGNHDSVDNSLYSASSLEPLQALPNVTVAMTPQVINFQGYSVTCLPYGHEIDTMKDFLKNATPSDLLVAHIGIEGAREGSGHSLSGSFTVDDLHPDKYNSVLLGHYHKRQQIGRNVTYGGNTIPMNFSDVDSKGILLVNPKSKDQLPVFVEIDNPKFMTITTTDEPIENMEDVMKSNFVRLRGSSAEIQQLIALDDVPVNIRTEVQESFDVESRIGITTESTPETVVSAYCDTFSPEAKETALFYITRAMKETR